MINAPKLKLPLPPTLEALVLPLPLPNVKTEGAMLDCVGAKANN